MTDHKTVLVIHKNISENIDEKMSELILEIWRANIKTRFCCEDHDGMGCAIIQFEPDELVKFLNRISIPMKNLGYEIEDENNPYPYYNFTYDYYPHFNKSKNSAILMTNISFNNEDINLITQLVKDKNLVDKCVLKYNCALRFGENK